MSATTAPVRSGSVLDRFEATDRRFVAWATEWAAETVQFPVLIASGTLERAEYPAAFPHLLLSACACADPARPLPALLEPANLAPSGWLLSPAVCYHAYSHWSDSVVTSPRLLSARGRCFRREAEFVPGERQLEFEMREIVLAGPAEWIESKLNEARLRIDRIATALGLEGIWATASDPFFLPIAQGKAHLQRLQETKKEYLVGDPSPLALASINRHRTFFGERFNISLVGGQPAHTACIAFGLDRWAHAVRPREMPVVTIDLSSS
jgi:hypothetical protein